MKEVFHGLCIQVYLKRSFKKFAMMEGWQQDILDEGTDFLCSKCKFLGQRVDSCILINPSQKSSHNLKKGRI